MKKIIKTLSIGLLLFSITSCNGMKKESQNVSSDTLSLTSSLDEISSDESVSSSISHSTTPTPYEPVVNNYVSNVEFAKKTNYGTNVENALALSKRIEDNILSKYSSSDVKKRKVTDIEEGSFRVEGLSGIMNFHGSFYSDGENKGFNETFNMFRGVMYSLLLSGNSSFDFDGVNFATSEENILKGIRIDKVNENTYMITRSSKIVIFGINENNMEYVMSYNVEENTFSVTGAGFYLSYYSSEAGLREEKDALLTYLGSINEYVSIDAFEFLFEKVLKEDVLLTSADLLKENPDYTIRNMAKKNSYYATLTSLTGSVYKHNTSFTLDTEGKVINASEIDSYLTLELPDNVSEVTSLDNKAYAKINISSIYIPSNIKTISKRLINTLYSGVIFTEYDYQEMPEEMLNNIREALPDAEIFYKGQFSVDENNKYIPKFYYVMNAEENEKGISIKDAMERIVSYEDYAASMSISERASALYEKCELYNNIYASSSSEEVDTLIDNYLTKVITPYKDMDKKDLFINAFNATMNSSSYYISGSFATESRNVTSFYERVNGNNMETHQLYYDDEYTSGYSVNFTLYEYGGNVYRYSDSAENKITKLENKDEFIAIDEGIDILHKCLKDVPLEEFVYSEEEDAYLLEKDGISLIIKLSSGYLGEITGSINGITLNSLKIKYVNSQNCAISKIALSYVPSLDDKYNSIKDMAANIIEADDENYQNLCHECYVTFDTIKEKETENEKDEVYLEMLNKLMDNFNSELFKLYYLDSDNKKVYVENIDSLENKFVPLYKELIDPTTYIKEKINKLCSLEGIVYFSVESNDTVYSFSYEKDAEIPYIKVQVGNDTSYSFIVNNNGKYVVIKNDQYVEITENLDKYQDIIYFKDIESALVNFASSDVTFSNLDMNYYVDGKYASLVYNDTTYNISDIYYDGTMIELNGKEIRVTINNICWSKENNLNDTEKLILAEHAND